jgi:transcriptional regulator with XRE-family HTH domain
MPKLHPLTVYRRAQVPPLSKAELAARLRTSRASVTRWENGARKIAATLLPEIAALTGIPARALRPDLAELIDDDAE